MSSGPLGKTKKALWQSLVINLVARSQDLKHDTMRESATRAIECADLIIAEMEKRFGGDAVLAQSTRPTITLKK